MALDLLGGASSSESEELELSESELEESESDESELSESEPDELSDEESSAKDKMPTDREPIMIFVRQVFCCREWHCQQHGWNCRNAPRRCALCGIGHYPPPYKLLHVY